ncbi:MAG: TIR domain-containing protein, partial [Anaerolineaceae bacterium]
MTQDEIMAVDKLSTQLFNEIKGFLEPYMQYGNDRKASIETALHGCNVLSQIALDPTTPALTFTHNLVISLMKYGVCDENDLALVLVLDQIGKQNGKDVQRDAEELIARIHDEMRANVRIGRYRLEEKLGQGGNGEVWRAVRYVRDQPIETVAIKILLLEVSRDEERVERFRREVITAAKLDHPNIVSYVDDGTWYGRDYLVLKFVAGGTLRERIQQGAIEAEQVIDWLEQVAAALDHAYEQESIIHRDVKPENILLSADGQTVYLTDFGLAVNPSGDDRITRTGDKSVRGTGRYMAPEQWLNAELRRETDVYGLGHLAYEMLTGVRAFHQFESKQSDALLSDAHRNEPIPRHPKLATKFWRIISKAASKQAEERYATASAMVAEMRVWLPKVSAHPPQIIVSYALEDKRQARLIADRLRRGGYQPRLTVDGVHPSKIGSQIYSEQMEECAAVVALLTSRTILPGNWVQEEIMLAIQTETPVIGLRLAHDFDACGIPADGLIDVVASGDKAGHQALLKALHQHAIPGQRAEADTTTANTTIEQPAPDNLHHAYLRRWFDEAWATVSLADYTDRDDRASLLDIYVSLPIDFQLNFVRQEGGIVAWWVDETIEGEKPPAENDENRPKRHDWPALGVGREAVQQIVDGFEYKMRKAGRKHEEQSFFFMEAHDAASVQPHFVLVGDPGSGKSSFVRHLTLCHAGALLRADGVGDVPHNASLDALKDWLLGAYIPLYIELRDLVGEAFPPLPADKNTPAEMPTLDDFWRYVRLRVLVELADYEPALREAVAHGEALILLDGLDEVSHAADDRRRQQMKALVGALRDGTNARIIVTSRPYAYKQGDWVLDGFGRAELKPLYPIHLHQLANALFRQMLGEAATGQVQTFIKAAEAKVEEDLRNNPLFFTLLAQIWLRSPQDERDLPTTTSAIYRQGVDYLLEKWTRRKGYNFSTADMMGLPLPAQLRVMLQIAACEVHALSDSAGGTTDFNGRLLKGIISDVRGDIPTDAVVGYLEERTGILISGRPNTFRFVHRSFQEHLAACELTHPVDQPRNPPVDADAHFPDGLVKRVAQDADLWLNVARLAADELIAAGRDDALSQLIGGLAVCPDDKASFYALQLADRKHINLIAPLVDAPDERKPLLEIFQGVALRLIASPELTPLERAEAGRMLAAIGDPRRGVGVIIRDGVKLPDIDWVKIPAGEF